jgi:hypothetical protein
MQLFQSGSVSDEADISSPKLPSKDAISAEKVCCQSLDVRTLHTFSNYNRCYYHTDFWERKARHHVMVMYRSCSHSHRRYHP